MAHEHWNCLQPRHDAECARTRPKINCQQRTDHQNGLQNKETISQSYRATQMLNDNPQVYDNPYCMTKLDEKVNNEYSP